MKTILNDINYVPKLSDKIELFENVNDCLIIYNRITKATYNFGENESKIIRLTDGEHSINDIVSEKSNKFDKEKTIRFFQYLEKIGIVASKQKIHKNFLKYKISIFYPDVFLSNHVHMCRHLDNYIYLNLIPSIIIAIISFTINSVNFNNLNKLYLGVSFLLSSFVCLLIHELSHAITAKSVNANVAEIGIMLYWFTPFAYTSICGMTKVKSRKKRIKILTSGFASNINILSISTILLFAQNSIINSIVLGIIIANATIIVSNMLIFLKLDLYYIIEELLNEKDFREHSINYVRSIIRHPLIILKKEEINIYNISYIVYSFISLLYILFLFISVVYDAYYIYNIMFN